MLGHRHGRHSSEDNLRRSRHILGRIDTQQILPFGTPEEVHKQVLERCRIFSRNGGFVFNTIHNVQARTPVKNIVAMLEAVHEFNGVPMAAS